MSVDVSPDGSTIAFDLLGDIYTVPIAGGKATRILGGNSIDGQPRYSPDGKSIVFTSDRSGVDATWIADADGRRPHLVTQGGQYPAWSPDGKQIITGNRLVDVRGGAGVPLQGFGTAPSFTGDGRYVWFQNGIQAARYDRQTGTISYRINLPGGVMRPMISRDGKTLAYFTRFEAQSALVLRDLATGADRWLVVGTQQQAGGLTVAAPGGRGVGASPIQSGVGPLPSSAWLPNGSAIVTSYGGKLWRVDATSGNASEIRFTADVDQMLGPLVKGSVAIGDSVLVHEIREPVLSPDSRRVAFSALGKVWAMDLNGGTPRRLTSTSGVVESSPMWTPDGQSVVFATWVDEEGGDIFQVDANGGTPRNLTRAPAMYARLNFTPDGSRLVFARAPRRTRTAMMDDAAVQPRTPAGTGTELNFELRWMPAGGGTQHPITMVADVGALPLGGFPHFTSDTGRVFFHDATGLVSVLWDGSDRKVVLAGATPQTVLSPDGVHVLSRAGRRRQIYMFERPQLADSVTVDPTITTPAVPVRRLTRAGGDFPTFSRDGSKAVWSSGTTLYVYDVTQGDRSTADSLAAALNRPTAPPGDSAGGGGRGGGRGAGNPADSTTRWAPAFEAAHYDVKLVAAADKPEGSVVLRGARVISMKEHEVIENADVVITGNRIAAVGPRGRVTIPSGARSIDVAGKTIIPGYVDINSLMSAPSQIHRTMVPQYLANLAYGVTSARDPETQTTDIFTYADRVATADLLGPRIFATGPTMVDSAVTMRTMAEARDFMRPYAASFPANTIRGDLAATRPDRQRFLMASRELGLTPVAVGTPDFRKSLSAILDGYANHQGAYEVFPLQDDVAKLIAESGLTYTPMLLGRVGTRTGIEYILATESPHADAKERHFSYHQDLDRITRARGTWMPPDEYPFHDIAASAARIVAAGGKVGIGSDGRVQGLGFHWEMWLLSKGGMPNHDILRAATVFGAEAIGAGTQLGSIEPGKLADLQVLDRNPLTDIRNTSSLRYVMKNGRLFDASTLDQITPTAKKMDKLWWLQLEPAEGTR